MFNPFKKSKPKGESLTLQISGMHCTSCALNIDDEMEELLGVISSRTNYAKSQTVVEYDSQKVKVKDLEKVIKTLGYGVGGD